MRIHHEEGLARHLGPEPCGGIEASAGEGAGQPLSRERSLVPGADAFQTARKARRTGASARAPRRPGVVEDPGMCRRSLHGNREISRPANDTHRWPAAGRRGAKAADARAREVRPGHSTSGARTVSSDMRAALAPAVTQAASRTGAIGVTGFAAARTFRRMAGFGAMRLDQA